MNWPRPGIGRLRTAWLAFAAVIVLLLVLVLDTAPALPLATAPTGEQVADGRDAMRRLRSAMRGPPPSATIAFTDAELRGIASLIGNATHAHRVDARLEAGHAHVAASLDLPLGLWLNVRVATAAVAGMGFPQFDVRIGNLALPRWLTHAQIAAARALLVLRGGRLPPLDRIVLGHRGTAERIFVVLGTPLDGTGVVRQIVRLRSPPVDGARVARLYCQLVAAHARRPAVDLATHVRRGVALTADGDVVTRNRELLVALAMLTVGERAADLADNAAAGSKGCRIAPPGLTLGGRVDLAKHWTLSAALGATLGGDVTRAMGEWKELSDSNRGGSGFSFVDLTADRAGLRIGGAAVNPARASAIRAALATASDAALLPVGAVGLSEGLSNAAFVARYGSIDDRDFASAIASVDRLLDRDPLLRAARD